MDTIVLEGKRQEKEGGWEWGRDGGREEERGRRGREGEIEKGEEEDSKRE